MGKDRNFCALCFSDENTNELLDIRSEELAEFKEKFNVIFYQKINAGISGWKLVCTYCVNKIEDFYEYFEKVVTNYSKLTKNLALLASHKKCDIKINSLDKSNPVNLIREQSEVSIRREENVKQECEEPFEIKLCERDVSRFHKETLLVDNSTSASYDSDSKKNELGIDTKFSHVIKVDPNFDAAETEVTNETFPKLDIPAHLKIRTPKKISDAQIRSFMDLICEICKSKDKFNTFKEMQLHYQNQHGTKGFIRCCGKKIHRKDRVMDHITLHINPDAFKCPKCGQRSKSRVLLRIHLKQHLPVEERPFKCNTCDQRFVLKSQLSNHQATHLSAHEKKYICDVCGKAFALKFVMLKHKATHTPEKPYFCEVCAKSFASKGNLTSHVRTHANEPEPRVQCTECGQWYKNIQTLRSHTHRHRDTRVHICEICSKKCSSKSSLLQHVRYVHQKVSNFECNICQKQFRRRPELTEHIARHTGEILYKCQFCPKTFYSSSNFFAHRKTKHPEEYANLSQQKQN